MYAIDGNGKLAFSCVRQAKRSRDNKKSDFSQAHAEKTREDKNPATLLIHVFPHDYNYSFIDNV